MVAAVAGVAPRAERALPHAFGAHAHALAPVPVAAHRPPRFERAYAPVLADLTRDGRRAPADRACYLPEGVPARQPLSISFLSASASCL